MLLTALLILFPSLSHAAEGHELRNTGGLFLTGEVLGSVFLGFMGPDLSLKPPPDPLTCADAWWWRRPSTNSTSTCKAASAWRKTISPSKFMRYAWKVTAS